MKLSDRSALKRYVETFGTTRGAAAAIGISPRAVTFFARSEEGADLIQSWETVFRLRTWRQKPEYVELAMVAIGQGLEGFTETHTRQIMEIERDADGHTIIDPETKQPRARVKSVETKRIKRQPDMRAVAMILGGPAPTPESGDVNAPPIVQITDELDDTI